MSWFISLSPLAKTSTMSVTPGTVLMIASSLSWKTSELSDRPNGSHSLLNFPQGVLNVVNNDLSMSNQSVA